MVVRTGRAVPAPGKVQAGVHGTSNAIAVASALMSRLYGEPFVSTRESIAWIPSTPPFEDSDVLVLSSRSTSQGGVGATLIYLDLRLSLPLGRTSNINWGFSGLRHTLSTSPLRMRWDHSTIDSRDDVLFDEGEMIYRDGIEIETGIGLNPATGQKEMYEEIWKDESLPAGSPFIFVSSSDSVEEATATMAVLGPHALALARESEAPGMPPAFRAVRMHLRTSTIGDKQAKMWEIVFTSGSSAQERELTELVGLADQACNHVRGGRISLGSKSWVVWDAGEERQPEVGDHNLAT